jgi:hypothetical protein
MAASTMMGKFERFNGLICHVNNLFNSYRSMYQQDGGEGAGGGDYGKYCHEKFFIGAIFA